MGFSDLLGTAMGAANFSIEVRSNVAPPIALDLPGAPQVDPNGNYGGVGAWILSLVKPSIRIQSDFGTKVIEPYGPPSEGTWMIFASVATIAALGTLALAVYGAHRLLK